MKKISLLVFLTFFCGALAQEDLTARIAELEQRIEQLEARLTSVPPPPTVEEIDGFTFARLDAWSGTIFSKGVGEISADQNYSRVTLRFTLYSEDGSIIGSDRFNVDDVGPTPRTFDRSISTRSNSEVGGFGIEVVSFNR